jgi:hypothetical protein
MFRRARRALAVAALAVGALGCGRLERECRSVTTRANTFIAEGERNRPKVASTPANTAREALDTAARYDRLAADLAAVEIGTSELRAEVDRYRALAERSAASLRAVARALSDSDFDTARRKRVELAAATEKEELPLVAKINEICGQR